MADFPYRKTFEKAVKEMLEAEDADFQRNQDGTYQNQTINYMWMGYWLCHQQIEASEGGVNSNA